MRQFNLFPFEIKRSPISGGSFVVYFSKRKRSKSKNLELAIVNEETSKVNEVGSWIKLQIKLNNTKNEMKKIITSFSEKKIIGFGSSASQTFLNFCGFNQNNLEFIIDNNSMKQNLYSPGTNIKIVDFESGLKIKP